MHVILLGCAAWCFSSQSAVDGMREITLYSGWSLRPHHRRKRPPQRELAQRDGVCLKEADGIGLYTMKASPIWLQDEGALEGEQKFCLTAFLVP